MSRNVIISIDGTNCYLDKTETGYWVTRMFNKLSLRFTDEAEARWFIDTFHNGDNSLVPTYIEWESYRKAS